VTKHEETSPPQASRSMSRNPSYDSAVLVHFRELYALTHTIQRNDTHRDEDKQESDCIGVERADVKYRTLGSITSSGRNERRVVEELPDVKMCLFTSRWDRSTHASDPFGSS